MVSRLAGHRSGMALGQTCMWRGETSPALSSETTARAEDVTPFGRPTVTTEPPGYLGQPGGNASLKWGSRPC